MFPDVSMHGAIYASSKHLAGNIQLLEYRQDDRKLPPPGSQPTETMRDDTTTPTTPQMTRGAYEGKSNCTPIVIDEGGPPTPTPDSGGTATTDDDRKPAAISGDRAPGIGTVDAEDTDDEDTPGQATAQRKRRRL